MYGCWYNVELDESTVSSLYSMASSPYCDVQREGVLALAQVSTTSANQRKLANSTITDLLLNQSHQQLIDVLRQVLTSKDAEVGRCASILLSNLCSQEPIRPHVVHHLLDLMVSILDGELDSSDEEDLEPGAEPMSPSSSSSTEEDEEVYRRETKRQVARALASLSETHASLILNKSQGIQQTLKKCTFCNDHTLQSFANLTLQRFSVTAF